ncbi:hypothetical protein ONZ45_g2965 [Pleurotus djamor]|nr:hypothetical protein ONZ45_g2965 [Pleurotus djamor]
MPNHSDHRDWQGYFAVIKRAVRESLQRHPIPPPRVPWYWWITALIIEVLMVNIATAALVAVAFPSTVPPLHPSLLFLGSTLINFLALVLEAVYRSSEIPTLDDYRGSWLAVDDAMDRFARRFDRLEAIQLPNKLYITHCALAYTNSFILTVFPFHQRVSWETLSDSVICDHLPEYVECLATHNIDGLQNAIVKDIFDKLSREVRAQGADY